MYLKKNLNYYKIYLYILKPYFSILSSCILVFASSTVCETIRTDLQLTS